MEGSGHGACGSAFGSTSAEVDGLDITCFELGAAKGFCMTSFVFGATESFFAF